MKKSGLLIVLVVLAGLAAYLYFFENREVSNKALRDFAVQDTSAVDRIFLADNDGNQSLLTRQSDGTWMVNNKWRARDNNVFLLLRGFYNMEVRSPVPEQAIPSILKQIASKPIKVEVYSKGQKEPDKIYYFGFATQDHYGSYALLEIPGEGKSTVPYIVKETGFSGFYRPRLITDENEWRYTGIFDYPDLDVASIEVDYPQHPKNSFRIDWIGGNEFVISNKSGESFKQFDVLAVKDYLLLYRKIHILSFKNYLNAAQEDSVRQQTKPVAIISVTDSKNTKTTAQVYAKGFIDPYLRDEKFDYLDPERFYIITQDDQLTIAQKLQWDPLLVPIQFFDPK